MIEILGSEFNDKSTKRLNLWTCVLLCHISGISYVVRFVGIGNDKDTAQQDAIDQTRKYSKGHSNTYNPYYDGILTKQN